MAGLGPHLRQDHHLADSQGISKSLLDVHSVKDVQQSLFFDFFTCQKYEQKNFKISLHLSLSATSLFTRAIWGGVGCFSAVVAEEDKEDETFVVKRRET